jgi:hypothetical protein
VALNEAELSSPLRPQEAGKVLIAESVGTPPQPALPGDFRTLTPAGREVIPLGGKKTREVVLQIGEGYGWPTAAAPQSALITRSLPQPTR